MGVLGQQNIIAEEAPGEVQHLQEPEEVLRAAVMNSRYKVRRVKLSDAATTALIIIEIRYSVKFMLAIGL